LKKSRAGIWIELNMLQIRDSRRIEAPRRLNLMKSNVFVKRWTFMGERHRHSYEIEHLATCKRENCPARTVCEHKHQWGPSFPIIQKNLT
jgi:hypothetical protein